jgi:hypothetical protein
MLHLPSVVCRMKSALLDSSVFANGWVVKCLSDAAVRLENLNGGSAGAMKQKHRRAWRLDLIHPFSTYKSGMFGKILARTNKGKMDQVASCSVNALGYGSRTGELQNCNSS